MEKNDVTPGSSQDLREEEQTQEDAELSNGTDNEQPIPGSQTPEANHLAALQEERKKRKELSQKVAELEAKLTNQVPGSSEDVYSDEGRLLKGEISQLSTELKTLKEEREIARVESQFPQLAGKADELREFATSYPGVALESVAKLYLSEHGLLTAPKKGLEKPTGGSRTPTASGMTAEDVAKLRNTNYKKYTELVMSGKLRPEDIK